MHYNTKGSEKSLTHWGHHPSWVHWEFWKKKKLTEYHGRWTVFSKSIRKQRNQRTTHPTVPLREMQWSIYCLVCLTAFQTKETKQCCCCCWLCTAERLSRKTPLQKPLFSWSWWFLIQQYLPATRTTTTIIRKTSEEQKLCHYFPYMSSTVFYALSNYTQEWNLLRWKMIYLSRRL